MTINAIIPCRSCGESLQPDDFYTDCYSGGIRQPCKVCFRARARQHSATEKSKEVKRVYREAHRDLFREWNKDYRARNPGMQTARTKGWAEENPEKRNAHNEVWKAIKRGEITQMPCEVCGASKAHAHHDDYERPLEVRWLCQVHHSRHHAAIRARS